MWKEKSTKPSQVYERRACFPKAFTVTTTKVAPKLRNITMRAYMPTEGPKVYKVKSGIVVGTDKGWSVFIGKALKEASVLAKAIRPLSIHRILIPLYAMLGIFGALLVADLPYMTTPSGFYQLIGDVGPFLTVVVAIILLWRVFRKIQSG